MTITSAPRVTSNACLLAAMLALSCAVADAQPATVLRSFYIQSEAQEGEQIVEVSQQGRDVRVRTITLAEAHPQCPSVVVRAYDVTLANTTVQKVAGTPLCGITQQRFDRAVGASRDTTTQFIDFFGSRASVVASCGGEERRFLFVEEPRNLLDERALARRDRDVSRVARIYRAATDGTLAGKTIAMPDVETREKLGTALVPELVSGKYESAYRDACWDAERKRAVKCEPNYFAWQLGGYTAPPTQRGPLPLKLIDHEKWQFVEYVPPIFPPIALSARVAGDVYLRLDVNAISGAVTGVTVARSIPLLDAAALTAAKQWRFVPGSTPADPFEVAVRFRVDCPGAARQQH